MPTDEPYRTAQLKICFDLFQQFDNAILLGSIIESWNQF